MRAISVCRTELNVESGEGVTDVMIPASIWEAKPSGLGEAGEWCLPIPDRRLQPASAPEFRWARTGEIPVPTVKSGWEKARGLPGAYPGSGGCRALPLPQHNPRARSASLAGFLLSRYRAGTHWMTGDAPAIVQRH